MKFNNSRGITGVHWESNEILHSDDLDALQRSNYSNALIMLAGICNGDADTAYVMTGLDLVFYTAMTVTLKAGIGLSYTGTYLVDDVWGFSADSGSLFGVFIPEDVQVAFDVGGSNNRIDIVEVRPVRSTFNSKMRNFKDPVTGLVTSSAIDTEYEYGYEFQVLKGTEASDPVAPASTAGWIKLAEVHIAGSQSTLTQDDIVGVKDSRIWSTDAKTTKVLTDILDKVITNEKRPGIDNTVIPKGIYEEYTNLIQDPCDLTTGNWSGANGVTATSTDLTINGLPFTKLTCDGTTDPYIEQTITLADTTTQKVGYCILHSGVNAEHSTEVKILQNGALGEIKGNVYFDWSTRTVNEGGTIGSVEVNWIDDNTVELWLTTDAGESGFTSWTFRIDPVMQFPNNGDYIYATACMLVDDTTTMFPFIDGTHSADVISVEQTMPDKFIFDMIVEPKFTYDDSSNQYVFVWFIDFTHRLRFYYSSSSHKYTLGWQDGGTESVLESNEFDDGDTLTNINQRIRIFGSLDFTDLSNSKLMVLPLTSESIQEDTVWSYLTDSKTSVFTTLSIGHIDGGAQANSDFEYLRLYSWDGVKPTITNNDDIAIYLQNQSMIFEAIPDVFVEREIPVGTPTSLAIQKLTDDIRTGVGIQDGAILDRHLKIADNTRSYTIKTGETLQVGDLVELDDSGELVKWHTVTDSGFESYVKLIELGSHPLTGGDGKIPYGRRVRNDAIAVTGQDGYYQIGGFCYLQLDNSGSSGQIPIDSDGWKAGNRNVLCYLDPDKVVYCTWEEAGASHGALLVNEVDECFNLTPGTEYIDSGAWYFNCVSSPRVDRLLVTYGTGGTVNVKLFSVSGTTVTLLDSSSVSMGNSKQYFDHVNLTETKAMIVGADAGAQVLGGVIVNTDSDTITFGTAFTSSTSYPNIATWHNGACKIDDTHVLIGVRGVSGSVSASLVIFEVDGSDNITEVKTGLIPDNSVGANAIQLTKLNRYLYVLVFGTGGIQYVIHIDDSYNYTFYKFMSLYRSTTTNGLYNLYSNTGISQHSSIIVPTGVSSDENFKTFKLTISKHLDTACGVVKSVSGSTAVVALPGGIVNLSGLTAGEYYTYDLLGNRIDNFTDSDRDYYADKYVPNPVLFAISSTEAIVLPRSEWDKTG